MAIGLGSFRSATRCVGHNGRSAIVTLYVYGRLHGQ